MYEVKILELDNKDKLTGNILFEQAVISRNKIEATEITVRLFKEKLPEVYKEYRHNYFIKTEEVEG